MNAFRSHILRMCTAGLLVAGLMSYLISASGNESSRDADEIYRVLLEGWNQFRAESSMAAVPGPPAIKPQVPSHMDTYMGPEPARSSAAIKSVRGEANLAANPRAATLDYHAIPLSGGTAIGAP